MAKKNFGKNYIDKMDYIVERNRMLVFFVFVLIAILIILVQGYLSMRNNLKLTIDLPPKIYVSGQLQVGGGDANKLYYRVWGEYIARMLGTYSPSTIRTNMQNISYILDPAEEVKYQTAFAKKIDFVESNIEVKRSRFYSFKVTGEPESADLTAKAIVKSDIGNGLKVESSDCTYTIGMNTSDYKIYVSKLQEECVVLNEGDLQKKMEEVAQFERDVTTKGEYK